MSTDAHAKRRRPDLDAERRRRLELEALHGVLARKRCPSCATTGAWKVYDLERTRGRIRYVKCLGCGRCDQVPVVIAAGGAEK